MDALVPILIILLVCVTSFVAGYASNKAILGMFDEEADQAKEKRPH